ncbi:MAG: Tn3 family transposase, partial [Endozoicomonas sp.]
AFGRQDRSWLLQQANQLIRIHAEPRFLLTELLALLENRRTTVPGYSTFQKIIAEAILQEQQRLMLLISHLPDSIKAELVRLLQRKEGHLSQLTALKKRAKDFSLKETRQEIQKHAEIRSLYQFACDFLPTLGLSNGNIHYYASLAEYYPVNRLLAMPESHSQLYLLCFIRHCFEQISDNLITSFIFLVNNATQYAVQAGKERLSEYHQANQQQLTKTRKLLRFFIDPDIDDEQPFKVIKQQVFAVVDEVRIQKMLDYLSGEKLSKHYYEWEHIHQQARRTTLNIRPLLMALDFGSTAKDDPVLVAANQLKTVYQAGKSALPPELIEQINHLLPKKLHPYVQQPSQYAFFIFQKLRESLDAGDIHFKGSTRFKSFEEDLASVEELRDKQPILDALGYPLLSVPMEQRLSELKHRLEQRYQEVNDNIRQGRNPHLKMIQKGDEITWRLPYKKQEDEVNNPFYEQLPQADIINVLQYVDQQASFLKSFRHIQPRYAKSLPDNSHILACLVAYGERIGLHSMADMSDIKDHLLRTTAGKHIRPETLRKANDCISNAIAQLPLFQHYDLELGSLHASADGQKFEAQYHTFKARYSRKYFGLNKGLVNYTLVANHVPINARLIGANEHESHYAFDIIFNNTSDVHPDIISTDMAGTNQVNFALLETFGRTWAPRYTQVNRKASRLVGFNSSDHYSEDDTIKPSARVNETLILTEAENLHRIFASMALKTTTQANLVRKLSSYARKNRTKKALWELDNIYMS